MSETMLSSCIIPRASPSGKHLSSLDSVCHQPNNVYKLIGEQTGDVSTKLLEAAFVYMKQFISSSLSRFPNSCLACCWIFSIILDKDEN